MGVFLSSQPLQYPLNILHRICHCYTQQHLTGSITRLELRSEEREQWQGEHTTIGRKSGWIILRSLLTEVLSIYFSKLRSNMLTANYCRAATASASPFKRKKAAANTNITHRVVQPDSNCGQKSESNGKVSIRP